MYSTFEYDLLILMMLYSLKISILLILKNGPDIINAIVIIMKITIQNKKDIFEIFAKGEIKFEI